MGLGTEEGKVKKFNCLKPAFWRVGLGGGFTGQERKSRGLGGGGKT